MHKSALSVLALMLCLLMAVGCSGNKGKVDKSDNTSKNPPQSSGNSESFVSQDDSSLTEGHYETTTSREWRSYGGYDFSDETLAVPDKAVSGNTAVLLNGAAGGAEEAAERKRREILETGDNLNITGKKYYISGRGNDSNDGTSPEKAWKTTDALAAATAELKSGDAVLFERGYIYRTNSSIVCKSGITYAAYGKGSKPAIYGSVQNYSRPQLWTPSKIKNVWKLDLPLTDAGIVVFDNGKAVGVKKYGLMSVKQNGDFYHNSTDNTFYLYMDKGRPNQVYNSIEIGTRRAIFTLQVKTNDVRIDNLCMKYSGSLAVQCIGYHNNIHITNCEVGWIGGSTQNPEDAIPIRYGNGLQFWDSASNCSIENNWVYQIYDAAITFQSNDGQVYENIDFNNNLIEYASYNIEFFLRPVDQTGEYISAAEGKMININMNNNILRLSGYGWGSQRDDSSAVSCINGWYRTYEGCYGFNICNNIFDCSTNNLVYMGGNWDGRLNVSGNSFYQRANESANAIYYNNKKQLSATDQSSLEAAARAFDKNPREIRWIS